MSNGREKSHTRKIVHLLEKGKGGNLVHHLDHLHRTRLRLLPPRHTRIRHITPRIPHSFQNRAIRLLEKKSDVA